MLRHLVLLQLDEGTSAATIDALVDGLRALPGAISEIEDYWVAVDAGLAVDNAQVAVVATFADIEAWGRYQDHPAHRRVIDEQVRPVLAHRSAFQVEL